MEALLCTLNAWKEVDLSTLQKTLDEESAKVIENQKESLVEKKKLAEATKEFRKVPQEQKLTEFKNLLKCMYSHIYIYYQQLTSMKSMQLARG